MSFIGLGGANIFLINVELAMGNITSVSSEIRMIIYNIMNRSNIIKA